MELKYKLKKIGDNYWLVHGIFFVACSNKDLINDDTKYLLHLSQIENLIFKDSSTKLFTLKDLERAYNKGCNTTRCEYEKNIPEHIAPMTFNEFIASLFKEKAELEVEIETEFVPVNHASGLQPTGHPLMDATILENYRPKITDGYINILKIIN